jgi:hypothetical protein
MFVRMQKILHFMINQVVSVRSSMNPCATLFRHLNVTIVEQISRFVLLLRILPVNATCTALKQIAVSHLQIVPGAVILVFVQTQPTRSATVIF